MKKKKKEIVGEPEMVAWWQGRGARIKRATQALDAVLSRLNGAPWEMVPLRDCARILPAISDYLRAELSAVKTPEMNEKTSEEERDEWEKFAESLGFIPRTDDYGNPLFRGVERNGEWIRERNPEAVLPDGWTWERLEEAEARISGK